MQTINWYPGHMAKTKRLLQDQIRRIDLVMEVCDARLPYSSRNPELKALAAGKKHLLFMNKSDLADPAASSAWLSHFRSEGIEAHLMNASRLKGKETVNLIDKATKELVEKSFGEKREIADADGHTLLRGEETTLIYYAYKFGTLSEEDVAKSYRLAEKYRCDAIYALTNHSERKALAVTEYVPQRFSVVGAHTVYKYLMKKGLSTQPSTQL